MNADIHLLGPPFRAMARSPPLGVGPPNNYYRGKGSLVKLIPRRFVVNESQVDLSRMILSFDIHYEVESSKATCYNAIDYFFCFCFYT